LLAYFRARVPRAKTDSEEAIEYVVANAASREQQQQCLDALIRKTEILWALLDCVSVAHAPDLLAGGAGHG
jgi:pyrroloquinoline-quinone synthase